MSIAQKTPDALPERYEPLHFLGEGGMGVVWAVKDKEVQRVGAFKAIRQASMITELNRKRFEREIRNVAQLVHPYIVEVYDVGRMLDGSPYIFMELVSGKALSEKALIGKNFDEIMMFFDRILEALAEAHSRDIIHRDLKPDNILISQSASGQLIPKLMDFGLALKADDNDSRLTMTGMVVGTPMYMAPEQACDEHYKICPATDLYALGCIFYEIFCGHPPFEADTAVNILMAQAGKPPLPFEPSAHFPEAMAFKAIIDKLLLKEPELRYDTAADLRLELRKQKLIDDGLPLGLDALLNNTFGAECDPCDMPFVPTAESEDTPQRVVPSVSTAMEKYSIVALREPSFTGRCQELSKLLGYLRDVCHEQRSAVCLITGRPGVGKTRLVSHFGRTAAVTGFGSVLHVDASASPSLFVSVFKAIFKKLLLNSISPQQVPTALARFFEIKNIRDERIIRLQNLFRNIGVTPPVYEDDQLSPLLLDALPRLCKKKNLILCIDNLQDGQVSHFENLTEALFQKTQNSASFLPVLITLILTSINYLPGELEMSLGANPKIWLRKGLPLHPLSNEDMMKLILGGLFVSNDLAPFVQKISCGYPLIAVELVRQWKLSGIIKNSKFGFVSDVPESRLPIPSGVHQAILQHLDLAFPNIPKSVWLPIATFIAVFNEPLTVNDIKRGTASMKNAAAFIDPNMFVTAALEAGVIKRIDDNRYAYTLPLMSDALKIMLTDSEIATYHDAVVRALKGLPYSLDNQKAIAKHLVLSKQHTKAQNALLRLAQTMLMQGFLAEALEYCEDTKKAVVAEKGVTRPDDPVMLRSWIIEFEAYLQKNDLDEAKKRLDWIQYAVSSLEDLNRHAQLMTLKSKYHYAVGNLDISRENAVDAYEASLQFFTPLSDDDAELKFHILLQYARFHANIASEILEAAKNVANPLFVAKAIMAVARQIHAKGDIERAKKLLDAAIDSANKNGDIKTQAEAFLMIADIHKDKPEIAISSLNHALECFEKINFIEQVAAIHKKLAELHQKSGNANETTLHEQWLALLGYK